MTALDSPENKRAGREKELRSKVKATVDRYESVFGKPLSTVILKEFLDESEKANRFNFLRDRLGVLSDIDINYLRKVLQENVVSEVEVPTLDESDLDDLDVEELGA